MKIRLMIMFQFIKFLIDVLNIMITCYIMLVGYMIQVMSC